MNLYDPNIYSQEEIRMLQAHDQGETLHAFIPAGGPLDYGICGECGDTEEGLMHNNTWRNVEPLMED